MNTELINPFLNSLSHVLTTMATLKIDRGPASINPSLDKLADVAVTANLTIKSNKLDVTLALSFTKPAILDIYCRMLGEDAVDIDKEVESLVGEITNMVTGSAKQLLDNKGFNFDMAIPLISTSEHSLTNNNDNAVIFIPFNTSKGHIFLQMQFNAKQAEKTLTA